MAIAPGGRLLSFFLLPALATGTNLNRGDSPLREILPGKLKNFQGTVCLAGSSCAGGSAANRPIIGHDKSDAGARRTDDFIIEEWSDDERYFGSATWSEASKPRMVDFSFGQASGPLLWWEQSDAQPPVTALAGQAFVAPETTFKWGDLRKPANPTQGEPSANMGMAILPLSLLGVFGLVIRRAH